MSEPAYYPTVIVPGPSYRPPRERAGLLICDLGGRDITAVVYLPATACEPAAIVVRAARSYDPERN